MTTDEKKAFVIKTLGISSAMLEPMISNDSASERLDKLFAICQEQVNQQIEEQAAEMF